MSSRFGAGMSMRSTVRGSPGVSGGRASPPDRHDLTAPASGGVGWTCTASARRLQELLVTVLTTDAPTTGSVVIALTLLPVVALEVVLLRRAAAGSDAD